MTAVLDSSALLAYFHRERGFAMVSDCVSSGAAISAVNWAETLSKLTGAGVDIEQAHVLFRARGLLAENLGIVPFTEEQALDAARLRPLTRHLGLSLGDRACLALGRSLGLPVLTADRDWLAVDAGVEVRPIR